MEHTAIHRKERGVHAASTIQLKDAQGLFQALRTFAR